MKVEVLISTYNGGAYLREQLESILTQKHVDIHMTIRDDGSFDDTVSILYEYEKKYSGKITVIRGSNIGYEKSFLHLLSVAVEDADYYAFSDQDDVWKDNKCYVATEVLKKGYGLYVSSIENFDKNLNFLSKNDFTTGIQSLKSDFARHRFSGCTMVFSKKIKELSLKVASQLPNGRKMPSHDFVVSSTSYYFDSVYVDETSYIYHRRTEKSLTSRGKGIFNRIYTEWNVLTKRRDQSLIMAAMLISSGKGNNNEKDYDFLCKVKNYQKSFKNKLKLIFEPQFSSGIFVCDIETKFKILINRF